MIGDKIKSLRLKKELSAKQLAEATSLTPAYLSMLEKGKRTNPSLDIIQELANALDTTVDYLLSDDEDLTDKVSKEKNDLTDKDKKDIEKSLDATLKQLEEQDGLMLSGNPVDDNDWELIKSAIKNGLEYAKKMNKEKYTPKKYKK